MKSIKPMIYKCSEERNPEILFEGKYRGYNFYIISYQDHPCAYVEVPKGHPWYLIDYSLLEDKISCHGGLTYSDNLNHVLSNTKKNINRWFFGWDYAHAGDYCAYDEYFNFKAGMKGKRWTTEEILEEVLDVIDQFIFWEQEQTQHDEKH